MLISIYGSIYNIFREVRQRGGRDANGLVIPMLGYLCWDTGIRQYQTNNQTCSILTQIGADNIQVVCDVIIKNEWGNEINYN